MWRALITSLALLLPATAASAAERVLLFPQDLSQIARSTSGAPASLKALRQAAATEGRVSVIVGLKVPFAPEGALPASEAEEQREEIAEATAAISARFASTITRAPSAVRTYETVPFMAMEVTPAELERLAADPNVISITENRLNRPSLKKSVQLMQGTQAHDAGYTGAGQTIAIIDTGVDKTHPFLGGRVVSEACYSGTGPGSKSLCPGGVFSSTAPGSGMPCSLKNCDHGTHVAGIAAGSSSSMRGVAPGAGVIAIQAFSRIGKTLGAWDADIAKGLERVFQLREEFSIAAVNLSLGGDKFTATCDSLDPAYAAILANLKAAGIATVASSGNDGFTDGISAPACFSDAVSVGAVSTGNWGLCEGATTAQDKVACFSNSASFLSLLAPGAQISSSVPGNKYASFVGTSMAAPHVAGAWAVIRQKSPAATVSSVLATLQNTGTAITDDRNGISKRRINVKAALDSITVPSQALSYVKAGAGVGTISFAPTANSAGCTANCSNTYPGNAAVTLTATPAVGSEFAGWSGACSGTAPRCTVIMSAARSVTASFNKLPTFVLSYTKAGTGNGSVAFAPRGTDASCAESCSPEFLPGTRVSLIPAAAPGSIFKGWQGACVGTRSCRVTMTEARSVTATFDLLPAFTLSYDAQGSGTGTITFTRPTGIDPCTGDCSRSFTIGTRVLLRAEAAAGSTFTGWGGICRGRRGCAVPMNMARDVTATFTSNTAPTTVGALEQP